MCVYMYVCVCMYVCMYVCNYVCIMYVCMLMWNGGLTEISNSGLVISTANCE